MTPDVIVVSVVIATTLLTAGRSVFSDPVRVYSSWC